MNQPFIFHRPVNVQLGDIVVPRHDYIRTAASHLNSQAVAILDLYAPKRSGKSTFCVQLASYLTASFKERYPVILELFQYSGERSYAGFLNGIFERIQRELSSVSAKLGMSLDLPPFVDHSLEPSKVTQEFLLRVSNVVQYLDRGGAKPDCITPKIYLILDGTESLQHSVFKSLVSGLRLVHHRYNGFRLMDLKESGVSIMLSGTEDIMAVYRREGGTPFSPALRLSLDDFSRGEIAFIVTAGFSQLGAAAHDYLAKRLEETTGGHPYLLQKICYVLHQSYLDCISTPWNINWEEVESITSHLSDDNIQLAIDYARSDPSVASELKKLCLEGTTTLLDEQSKVRRKLYASGVIRIMGTHLAMRNNFYRRILTKYYTEQETKGDEKMRIHILFLAADPTDASRLRLGEEFRELQEKLKLAKLRDQFRLELPQLSVRPADISQALLDVEPQIVHFSGHGSSTGALCFENQTGQVQFVQPNALAALFEQFANQVNCVLLNACYSETQAKAIAEHIEYVIGMNQAISDKAAIAFAIGFYQALGAGRTIENAHKLGCVQIRLQGVPEHLTPVLIKKGQAQP